MRAPESGRRRGRAERCASPRPPRGGVRLVVWWQFPREATPPTLCPCSKEISEYGAHNQRADVSIKIKMKKFLWIEDLVEIAEDSASAPVYSLLKRPDEKYVTEHAYDNPRFVEDVCREVKLRVSKLKEVENFCIEVESQESIHNHSAYAMVVG